MPLHLAHGDEVQHAQDAPQAEHPMSRATDKIHLPAVEIVYLYKIQTRTSDGVLQFVAIFN